MYTDIERDVTLTEQQREELDFCLEESGDPMCEAELSGYGCTRKLGHTGKHYATSDDDLFAFRIWSDA